MRKTLWLVGLSLASIGGWADQKVKIQKKRPDLASVAPVPMPSRKDEMVRFLACDTENECLKLLQQAELQTTSKDETFVAEFVETPRKGVAVYRRKSTTQTP